MSMQPAPIHLRDVSLSYGHTPVLAVLLLSVAAGSVTALLGGNGAGKSTTLSVLLGLARASRGEAAICGIDPAADPDAARRRVA